MTVRVRIAPSPTGYFHFGTARTALFNYLFAKQKKGVFILRIEDTDTARNKTEYEDDIHEQLTWLGLTPDETYKQSQRSETYIAAITKLIDSDKAYISKEPAKDDPERTVEVVRLRNAGTTVSFSDMVRGEISFDTTELGDFVIARSATEPLYHLAVVVDDAEMNITHVIRGEDHISNTPRQILIQEALGYARPEYAHIPLILAADRSKMSKRKHDTALKSYREQGFLPEALTNYLALLGWNPGTEQELFSRSELESAFSMEHIQKSGAVFDIEKLRWFNREYLLQLPGDAFMTIVFPAIKESIEARRLAWDEGRAQQLLPLIRERISTVNDVRTEAQNGEYDYFFATPEIDTAKINFKDTPSAETKENLLQVQAMLSDISVQEFSSPEKIKNAVWEYAEEKGRGAVLWPLRFSLTGKDRSPDPFTVASILGKDETISRIERACSLL